MLLSQFMHVRLLLYFNKDQSINQSILWTVLALLSWSCKHAI